MTAAQYWLTILLPFVELFYLGLAGVSFVALLYVSAPYGRHSRAGWGIQLNATFGWVLMESVALVVPALCIWLGGRQLNPVTGVFIAMWFGHYIHRAWIYPWRRRRGARQIPLLVVLLAIIHNSMSGYINSWEIFFLRTDYTADWFLSWQFMAGILLFTGGAAINISADNQLLRLRRRSDNHYRILNQGLHNYVASPNYLGEIIQWIGWAIATWSFAGSLLVLFTLANLVPRAFSHLRWYRGTFADYPPQRKALIPRVL